MKLLLYVFLCAVMIAIALALPVMIKAILAFFCLGICVGLLSLYIVEKVFGDW
jgi:hypothetical protein